MKLAVWSGPRNLSTAMMYAFANRADFMAVDEPFYAAYLARTGLAHPMRDEILASQPTDPAQVVEALTRGQSDGTTHHYQKHMAQHMIPGMPRDWIETVTNVFLIRHPARVVASFTAKYDDPTLADIGFVQQVELYEQLAARGQSAVVIDSADIRQSPENALRALCAEVGLAFDPAMLAWDMGPKPCDGAWAPHWYGSVHASTGFAGAEGPLPKLSGPAAALAEAAMPYYETLSAVALRP